MTVMRMGSVKTEHSATGGRDYGLPVRSFVAVLSIVIAGCGHVRSSEETSHEYYDAIFVSGQHVAYSHTKVSSEDQHGEDIIRVRNATKFTVKRFQDQTSQDIVVESTESNDGKLLGFQYEMTSGKGSTRMKGHVENGVLKITDAKGHEVNVNLPDQCKTIYAVERSLSEKKMSSGETRSFVVFMPLFNRVATVKLTALEIENVKLLERSANLLRVNNVMTLPNGQVKTSMWVDDDGIVVKTESGIQTTYRVPRATAISVSGGSLDIGEATLVRVKRAIANPHQTIRARYRAAMKEGNPGNVFPSSEIQIVTKVDATTAEIEIQRPIVPSDPKATTADDKYLRPNSMIQSDDDVIKILSQNVPDHDSAWIVATSLARLVHSTIREKNFSTAMASAAEVARERAGDCTEHAVLLAALCRAKQIPSRVAVGLVYHGPSNAFAYHMWTEVAIGEKWIPLDSTLSSGQIGATHIKLSDASFDRGGGFDSFLPVLDLMGKLELEVIDLTYE